MSPCALERASEVRFFLDKSQFSSEDNIWFKSPLGMFQIGIWGHDIVYYEPDMRQSIIIDDQDPISSIRHAIIREIMEL